MRSKAGNSSIHLFIIILSLWGSGVRATPDAPTVKHRRFKAVGDGMEAMMLAQLLGQMRKSAQLVNPGDDNPFAPSHAEMIFRSMTDQQIVENLAAKRPLGFGNLVERRLEEKSGSSGGDLVR